jgi:hypothetical protein
MDMHTSCKILNTSFRVSNKISNLLIYLSSASVGLCYNLRLTCTWNKKNPPFVTT